MPSPLTTNSSGGRSLKRLQGGGEILAQPGFDPFTGKQYDVGTSVQGSPNIQNLLLAPGVPRPVPSGLAPGTLEAGYSPRKNVQARGQTVETTQRGKAATLKAAIPSGSNEIRRKRSPFLALPSTPNPSLFGINIV